MVGLNLKSCGNQRRFGVEGSANELSESAEAGEAGEAARWRRFFSRARSTVSGSMICTRLSTWALCVNGFRVGDFVYAPSKSVLMVSRGRWPVFSLSSSACPRWGVRGRMRSGRVVPFVHTESSVANVSVEMDMSCRLPGSCLPSRGLRGSIVSGVGGGAAVFRGDINESCNPCGGCGLPAACITCKCSTIWWKNCWIRSS